MGVERGWEELVWIMGRWDEVEGESGGGAYEEEILFRLLGIPED